MHLDKTQIVVRQRGYLDILDLALLVIRRYAVPLAIALAVGIVPMFLFNAYWLSGFVEPEVESGMPALYMYLLVMWVIWEIPLAMAPATLYLGHAVFQQQPSPRRLAGDFFRSLPQLFLYQVLLRGLLVWPVIPWLWLFSQYTFLSEVILLERNPLRQRTPAKPSTGRRCRMLHSGVGGDLFVRWMGAVALGVLLVLSVWLSIWFVRAILLSKSVWVAIWLIRGLMFNEWEVETVLFTHYFHASLWLVVAFFTVARFLCYLDTRIRREGWEVELIMRAESQRLAGPEAG